MLTHHNEVKYIRRGFFRGILTFSVWNLLVGG